MPCHHFALVPVAGVPRPAFKWHAVVRFLSWHTMLSTPSGMPSPCFGFLVHWRATPGCSSGTPKWGCELGVPRFRSQVARPGLFSLQFLLWNLVLACHAMLLKWHAHSFVGSSSLACHAWLLKWHAQVTFEVGVPRLRHQVACPIVSDGLGVPRLTWHVTPL
ncbi:hypothetical protein AHAS_Ahas10G0136000 [Arachis hypogaea]